MKVSWLLLAAAGLAASQTPAPRPRIHVYDLPPPWKAVPHETCFHWDCQRLTPLLLSSPYYEPDPEKADLFYVDHLMPFASPDQAAAMWAYIQATWPYVNRSIVAGQTRHFIGLTCDHGPGDCSYMLREDTPAQPRRLPGWWDPWRAERVVGHIQWNGMRDGVDSDQSSCLTCFQARKDVMIATSHGGACGVVCGYNLTTLRRHSVWSRGAEHRELMLGEHEERKFKRTNLLFYGGRILASRGADCGTRAAPITCDPTGRAQVLALRALPGSKVVNTAGDDPSQPLPVEVTRLWRNFGEEMSDSEFCFSPLGQSEGDTDRYIPAIMFGCIPVMLTDTRYGPATRRGAAPETLMAMPMEEHPELDWSRFSVQVSLYDLSRLPLILSAISPKKRLEMRKAMAAIWPRFLWTQMHGRDDLLCEWSGGKEVCNANGALRGSYLGEDGSADAFESLVDILRLRVDAMPPLPH